MQDQQENVGVPDAEPSVGLSVASPQPSASGLSTAIPHAVAIGELITTQDSLYTADPLYVVFQNRRIYGIDTKHDGPVVWYSIYGEGEAEEEMAADLENAYQENSQEPEGWMRTSYVDVDVFCTACFTRNGCEEYLRVNGHNLNEPFIYVESLRRNEEMIGVRGLLVSAFRDRAEAEIPQPVSGEELQP